MPDDAESAGADKPESSAFVTRDELSGVLEDMMGRMMTRLARSQQESLNALRSDLTAQINTGAAAAAAAVQRPLTGQAVAGPATSSDLNAAFAAQRAAEARAAQALVARQAVAAKLRADYEAQMLAAGIALPAAPVAAAGAGGAPARSRSDFKSTVDQVVINADPTNNVTAAVMRRRMTDNRQLPKPQQNINLAPRRALWGADPQLTRGAVTSSREEAMRRAVRPPASLRMAWRTEPKSWTPCPLRFARPPTKLRECPKLTSVDRRTCAASPCSMFVRTSCRGRLTLTVSLKVSATTTSCRTPTLVRGSR